MEVLCSAFLKVNFQIGFSMKLWNYKEESKAMEEDNMGIKMKKAKFDGEDIKISDFKESMRGNLYCI